MNPFERQWCEDNQLPDTTPTPVLTYPTSLPHDMALCMTEEEVDLVRLKYGFDEAEWDYILCRQDFKRELSEWRHRLIAEGNSFRLKLRAMAEEFLPNLHQILHSDLTAPSVKVDAFKYMTKVAELEPPKEVAQAASTGQQTRMVISWGDGSGQVAIETKQGGQ